MATVQDILQIPELELRLLAGARCAVNQVRWVHVAEVPGAEQNLKGGELLLTAGDGFAGSAAEQARHLGELAERGIAGLGFATGFAFDEVPPALVTASESLGVPLFEIPRRVALSAMTEAVTAKIVNEQYSLLQRSLAVHEKLATMVLEERGLEEMLGTLSGLVGCSAVLFDFHGLVLCEAAARRSLDSEAIGEVWGLISDRRASRAIFVLELGGAGLEVQVLPVVAAHRIGAFLAVVKDTGAFGEYDRVILHNVVTAIALELVKKKAVAETERRLVGDFLDQLVEGNLDEDEITRRLTFFGLAPHEDHVIVIVEVDVDVPGAAAAGEREKSALRAVPERLHATVDEFMAERRQPCISASRGGRVVVLLQPGAHGEEALRGLAAELHAWIGEALPETSVSLGIGRPRAALGDLRRSYYEASYALRIRRLSGSTGFLADYGDLGSYSLLLGLQDTPSLEVFCHSVLGKLEDHDEENGSDLLPSLACFLEANGHWGDAADKLFVHRHTLRYRMRRVQEITGRDLSEPQDRMEFWLALKAKKFLAGSVNGRSDEAS